MISRCQEICKAASTLFIRQGYSRTQINHIAKSIGVSVGTIYHEFAGKKEIMQFVLKCTISPEFLDRELKKPITEDLFCNLNMDIETKFDSVLNEFSTHTSKKNYSFENYISDAFDLVSQYAVCILFIEKNQYEFETLAAYYTKFRARFFDIMKTAFTNFIDKGDIRTPKYIDYAVLHIIETLTLWGMDIHYKNYNVLNISPETAKNVVFDNLIPLFTKK
ncbi:MAG: helix-turn-helix transcriptional regulator [Spirochaetes bacterium]|nr:helix-turn-helix transcriptional regulator [Spirochaetota bacterium]MBN2771599.1 helix-turn-helix transcriptional regulator [Spirochaetota bacterium]